MKNAEVTSCSHSLGLPMVRVTMSSTTQSEKPAIATPHSTISSSSMRSKACHLR